MSLQHPSRAQQQAAAGRTLPDVIAPGLRVLFCGINPSLYSAAVGHHFARPGNRFWPTLHQAGFTPRLLSPREEQLLPDWGCGITSMVARATATAAELGRDELLAGRAVLEDTVRRYRPRWVAVVGIGAYHTAFGRPKAVVGCQAEDLAGAGLWVLPNPSGLNANHQLPQLVRMFAELERAAR